MSLLCVGSVAYDTIITPFGRVNKTLGGSATYFSLASSLFAPTSIIAVVGSDFRDFGVFKSRKIDISGIEKQKGKTFHWAGKYHYDLNTRDTLKTELGVFADFKPKLDSHHQNAKYVFLGNIQPKLQLDVLNQIRAPKLVGLDTMNLWIETAKKDLLAVLKKIDLLVINDSEARQLSKQHNLIKAAKIILGMMRSPSPSPSPQGRGKRKFPPREGRGDKILIIKQGEHGLLMFHHGLSLRVHPPFRQAQGGLSAVEWPKQSINRSLTALRMAQSVRLPRPSDAFGARNDIQIFNLPGYPLEDVTDPTGAGDSFAGALIGYLAKTDDLSRQNLKKACAIAGTVASFCVEGFGTKRLQSIKLPNVSHRLEEYKKLINF